MAGLALALAAFLTGCSSAPEPAFRGGPRLSAEPAAVDFGTVAEGTQVKANFTLTNVGDATLAIEKAATRVVEGCCPPTPQLSSQELAPGKKATLTLEFTMVGDMVGPHRFEVLVYSNDAVSSVATLEVKGTYLSQ
ncbi:MAG: DUF1573 domain-containing protein [Chloroflexi bacterium]|nr:DUF1573 domain-containing protein [Chloroflexota bacterium]